MTGRLSIVVPVLNEEGSMREVLRRLIQVRDRLVTEGMVTDVELLIVDDGSTDRTAELVQAVPEARLIRHLTNAGYGAALKTGFRQATGDYLAFLDADLSYRPESIPALLERLVQAPADLVVGSRMMRARGGMSRIRRFGNWIFARVLWWLTGVRITDAASGLRVFRREALPQLLPLPDGLSLTPAMSARALHEGLRLIEVPIPYDKRAGRSKLSLVRDGIRFFSGMLAISRLYNPLKLFGLLGCVALLTGVALGLGPVLHYLQVRRVEEFAIYRLFAVMVLCITGINVMTFGAFCNEVLQLLYPRRPAQPSVWGRVLLNRRLVALAGQIGGLCMAGAVILNHRPILEYVTTGHVTAHWSYTLTGATLFLTGLQLVMCRFFLTVLGELREARQVWAGAPPQGGRPQRAGVDGIGVEP